MENNLDDRNMKEEFVDTLRATNRNGMDDLLDWLENKSDFFTAPASTKYHGAYSGGLLEHSTNVYVCLSERVRMLPKLEREIDKHSIAIVALLHDITKANYYTEDYRNVKVYSENGSKRDPKGHFDWEMQQTYKVDDKLPLGHGEKSVIMLQNFIKLSRDEMLAIRWHMGAFDNAVKGGDNSISAAYEQCPLAVLLHLADMEATYLME